MEQIVLLEELDLKLLGPVKEKEKLLKSVKRGGANALGPRATS